MLSWLNGKKTYIGMIAGGMLGIAVSAGWVEWEKVQWIAAAIAAWTGVAITHKADKAIGKTEKVQS
jgi:outer membrane lipoprotein SlyB